MGRPGSSSLAASPILEKVMMMSEGPASGGSPITLKQKKRRSLQQQVLTTTRNAVLDRAADAIVFDLINLESSANGSQVAVVDPNSSVGKSFKKKKFHYMLQIILITSMNLLCLDNSH